MEILKRKEIMKLLSRIVSDYKISLNR